jgi:hypothetical protein
VHHRTSTWDLPSSIRTARPQRTNKILKDMSDRTPNKISENIFKKIQNKIPENMPNKIQKIY